MNPTALIFRPRTPDTWDDFETVMGESGGARRRWCMYWAIEYPGVDGRQGRWQPGRDARAGRAHGSSGVVAYLDDEPVAWCGFGDRSDLSMHARSSPLQPVDEEP